MIDYELLQFKFYRAKITFGLNQQIKLIITVHI